MPEKLCFTSEKQFHFLFLCIVFEIQDYHIYFNICSQIVCFGNYVNKETLNGSNHPLQGTKDHKQSFDFTVSLYFLPVSSQSRVFGSHWQAPVPFKMLLKGVLAESVGQHLLYTILQQVLGGLCDGIHWNHVSVTMQNAGQTNIVKSYSVHYQLSVIPCVKYHKTYVLSCCVQIHIHLICQEHFLAFDHVASLSA